MTDTTTTTDQSADRDGQQDDQHQNQNDELGEKGQAAIKAERDARKKAERDLKSAQTRLSELEGRDKSDVERLTGERDAAAKRATDTETRLRDANARSAVADAAGKVNAISTRAVYAMIRADLEFDDDGDPTNVDALIKQAQKDEPSLFRAAAGSGDGGRRDSNDREISPGLDRLTYAYEKNSRTANRR